MSWPIILVVSLVLVNCMLTVLLFLQNHREKQSPVSQRLEGLERAMRAEFSTSRQEAGQAAKSHRDELAVSLERIRQSNDQQMAALRDTVQRSLRELQEDNNRKLEQMRATVDEKLQTTLERRLGDSFKLVSERLELVHQGLGEMQNLASGVGDLKRVLSNVKTRGILGEIQLESILEQLLAPEQYDKNVATKRGGREQVEFAVKLPGRDSQDGPVYLPIDAKFPLDMYHALVDAYEQGHAANIETAAKALDGAIRRSARDIRGKYLDPPHTTDFAIMFLPVEGLYAEVVRRPQLLEQLQRDFKVNVAGPTTLAALLNSLQLGFRTLAIEQRSSEVWQVLGAVKTEFEKFGGVLGKTQERLNQASNELDTLIGVRTRQIQRKLRTVQELTSGDPESFLDED